MGVRVQELRCYVITSSQNSSQLKRMRVVLCTSTDGRRVPSDQLPGVDVDAVGSVNTRRLCDAEDYQTYLFDPVER